MTVFFTFFVGRALVYHGGRPGAEGTSSVTQHGSSSSRWTSTFLLISTATDTVVFFHIFLPLQVANISRARGVGTNRRDDDERCANSGGGFNDRLNAEFPSFNNLLVFFFIAFFFFFFFLRTVLRGYISSSIDWFLDVNLLSRQKPSWRS